MRLFDILSGVDVVTCASDNVEIETIAIDSRRCVSGALFIAMNGTRDNGTLYVNKAMMNGARVVVAETLVEGVPCVVVKNIRQAYCTMSANFFDHPEEVLKVIAVIGTNGKSSTAHYIREILEFNGFKVGLIGTGIVRYADITIAQDMTTPDPFEREYYFSLMKNAGMEYVVMEVSAQAIYFEKMHGIKCEIGLFTNLSEDHLDFFKSMDVYKMVKMSYFNARYLKVGIVNSDDEVGREIISQANMPVFTYGLDNPSDVFAIDLEYCADKTRFVVNILDEISHFATDIVGKYNVYNILGASLVARLLGVPMYGIREGVAHIKPLDGRYNVIRTDRADMIVDYAHTPRAMEEVIRETRAVRHGRLIVVFGCGGDRDRTKRHIMGETATRLADEVVITSDNSRTEKTADIITDILDGNSREHVTILEDRLDAIRYAYEISNAGDTVLVLGKGAEDYQDNGDGRIYFSDREAILDVISKVR